MSTSLTRTDRPRRHRNGWLQLIALFKLLEATLFVGLGFGVLHLIHTDIDDVVTQILMELRFNPESNFVNFVLEKASNLDEHMLRRISTMVFVYAALAMVEGIGLYLEKFWAEYFSLLLTALFLPYESLHLAHHPTWPRALLLLVNLLVLLYLGKLVVAEHVRRAQARKV